MIIITIPTQVKIIINVFFIVLYLKTLTVISQFIKNMKDISKDNSSSTRLKG